MKTLTVKRPWGKFDQFTHNEFSTVKIISVNPDESLSLQSHTRRSEFWRIIKGNGVVEIGDIKYNVKEDDEKNIPIGVKHRATAGPLGLVFLEIASGDFREEDFTRYEDKYGRV